MSRVCGKRAAGPSGQRCGLELVLIAGADAGRLDHLGVEVASTGQVAAAAARLSAAGPVTFDEHDVECCYARQDKVWAHAPDDPRCCGD